MHLLIIFFKGLTQIVEVVDLDVGHDWWEAFGQTEGRLLLLNLTVH